MVVERDTRERKAVARITERRSEYAQYAVLLFLMHALIHDYLWCLYNYVPER